MPRIPFVPPFFPCSTLGGVEETALRGKAEEIKPGWGGDGFSQEETSPSG